MPHKGLLITSQQINIKHLTHTLMFGVNSIAAEQTTGTSDHLHATGGGG